MNHPVAPLRAPQVCLVVPVKRLNEAKSRLSHDVAVRRAVATALAEWTIGLAVECLRTDAIYVVTEDEDVKAMAQSRAVQVVPDPGTGLNDAADAGLRRARLEHPEIAAGVLVADLPWLTAGELRWLIHAVAGTDRPLLVPDLDGDGTTFVAVPAERHVPMVFGEKSASQFHRLGCEVLRDAPPGLRSDLDSPDDLARLLAVRIPA